MTWVSVLLVGLGVADLVRAALPRRRWAAPASAVLAIGATGLLAGLHSPADIVALTLGAAGAAGWIELASRTELTGRRAGAALALLVVLLAGLVAFSGYAGRPDGALGAWLRWADLPGSGPAPETGRVLLLSGVTLANLATANVVVRLVLLTTGALRPEAAGGAAAPQAADRLRGGRLLGPMERILILGLGLAGELGAASLVIAAKGLLRFPEIQAAGRSSSDPSGTADPSRPPAAGGPARVPGRRRGGPVGIDDVTEYFLVGSFVSWLLALVSLAMTR
mgnify:CR=1 FL=1